MLVWLVTAIMHAIFWTGGAFDVHAGSNPGLISIANDAKASLLRNGWTAEATDAVVALNADWFAALASDNPTEWDRELKLLGSLGNKRQWSDFLVLHPESASLLAGPADAEPIMASLRAAGKDLPRVLGLYVQHASPQDALALAAILPQNGHLICQLLQRGLISAESLFIVTRQDAASTAFGEWQREVLENALTQDEEQFDAVTRLVIEFGPSILERMEADPEFRRNFGAVYWPRFLNVTRAVPQLDSEVYLSQEHLWDVLKRTDGELLLKRCGVLAVSLLYGDPACGVEAWPQDTREVAAQMLAAADDQTITAMQEFRNEPLFFALLQRKLPARTLAAACDRLVAAHANYPALLHQYQELSDVVLAEEVGPAPDSVVTWLPLYASYSAAHKLYTGRKPSTLDLLSAGADLMLFIAPGSELVGVTGKEGSTVLAQFFKHPTEEVALAALEESGREYAGKALGERLASDLAQEDARRFGLGQALRQTRAIITAAWERMLTLEITRPVQFMFKLTNIGRATIRRLTGLEARLFMRADGRVAIRFGKLIYGPLTERYLKESAIALGLGESLQTDEGQTVVEKTNERVDAWGEHAGGWARNVSVWWLINGDSHPTGAGSRT